MPRRGRLDRHRAAPGVEGLEDRKLLATLVSVAYNSVLNSQVTDVVYGNGSLYQFQLQNGAVASTQLAASGIKSVGIAFDKLGNEVQTIVHTDGTAYQNGTLQGGGVESETVAFDPLGRQVNTVVYTTGQLYQFDSAGTHYLGTNVLSASLAYDLSGNAVEDVVFTNQTLYEFDGVDASSHLLASNVVSVGVTISSTIGEVQEVVYSTGDEYQYSQDVAAGNIAIGSFGSTSTHNGKVF